MWIPWENKNKVPARGCDRHPLAVLSGTSKYSLLYCIDITGRLSYNGYDMRCDKKRS